MEENLNHEEKLNEAKIVIYKELQNKLIEQKTEINIPEGFKIEILEPDCKNNAFNYDRGFFTCARIYYKEHPIGVVRPNFHDYRPELGDGFSFSLYNLFKDFADQVRCVKHGINETDEQLNQWKEDFFKHDFETIQECLDYAEAARVNIEKTLTNFLTN